MAKSPFDYFRQHAGIGMVVLCVLLMLTFVIGDALAPSGAGPSGGAGANAKEVAVSWEGGKLTELELGRMVYHRRLLAAFQQSLIQEGARRTFESGATDYSPTTVAPLELPTQAEQHVEESVLSTHVLANAARDAGMVISDAAIADYLDALGRERVSRDDMARMLANIGGDRPPTPEFIFELLRESMLARSYAGSFLNSRLTVMPQQRWRDWLKVSDRVVVETAAIPIADYLRSVPEPSEKEIEEFYQEYKDAIPGDEIINFVELPSPTPGFTIPDKAQVQWLRADFLTAMDEARAEVTDEEIAKYYEEHKEDFIKADTDLMTEEDEADIEVVEEEPSEGEPKTEEPKTEEPANEEPGTAEPGAEDPGAEEPGAEEPGAEEPNTDEPNPEEPSTEDQPPAVPESASTRRAGPFQLASFQEEPSEEPAGEPAAAPSDEPAAPSEESQDKPADTEKKPGDLSEFEEFLKPEDDEAPPVVPEAREEEAPKPVEYESLEEASELIRENLAGPKAGEKMLTRMTELKGLLQNDYYKYFNAATDADADGYAAPEPPKALVDWEKLAEENHLEFGKTELISMEELKETAVGKLFPDEGRARLFLDVFRTDGMDLYEPKIHFSESERDLYLTMKLKDQKGRKPKLEEIRDQIVAAWKKMKAAELAIADAKKQAEAAQTAGTSLAEFFADKPTIKVEESERFSWLTPRRTSERIIFRLDSPGTVEAAGPDFMKETFSLGPNQIGAALDHGHNTAYVIRIVDRERSQSDLRQEFLRDWNEWTRSQVMIGEYSTQVLKAMINTVLGGEEPDWKRTPDQPKAGM